MPSLPPLWNLSENSPVLEVLPILEHYDPYTITTITKKTLCVNTLQIQKRVDLSDPNPFHKSFLSIYSVWAFNHKYILRALLLLLMDWIHHLIQKKEKTNKGN